MSNKLIINLRIFQHHSSYISEGIPKKHEGAFKLSEVNSSGFTQTANVVYMFQVK